MMKQMVAAGLAAGMFLSTMIINMGVAEMADKDTGKREAVKIVQTAGRDRLGDFAPDFARYNDDILFGEVWSKNDVLSLHDRSIVTVSALVASGVIDSSLKFHIASAKKNGVTKDEMVEIDRAVMAAYGFDVGSMTEAGCVAELMRRYQELVERE